jgi:hypothetical protein
LLGTSFTKPSEILNDGSRETVNLVTSLARYSKPFHVRSETASYLGDRVSRSLEVEEKARGGIPEYSHTSKALGALLAATLMILKRKAIRWRPAHSP